MEGRRSALRWAVVLLTTVFGLYAYGFVSYEPDRFQVTWSTVGVNHVEQSALAPGAEARFTSWVPAQNLTTFAASVAWTDDLAPPDRLVFNVTGPFGEGGAIETRQVDGTVSPLTIEVPFLSIPTTSVVRGTDPADALAKLSPGAAPWSGDAAVRVSVWLAEANGDPGLAGGIGARADEGNDVRLSVSYTQYRATLTPTA